MKLNWGLITGDICDVRCDAVVNAANTVLLGGGGVDGAIHRAAGSRLQEYILKHVPAKGRDRIDPTAEIRCDYGEVLITPSFDMKNCDYIIHTVGPIWMGGRRSEVPTLLRCYYASLDLALAHGFQSIAFPSISTGCFKFPLSLASQLATHAVSRWLKRHDNSVRVFFVAHDDETYNAYESMMEFTQNKEDNNDKG